MDKLKLPLKKNVKKLRKIRAHNQPLAQLSDATIVEVYKAQDFNKSKTAKELGMSRSTLNIRINGSPQLQEMMIDAHEEVLDIAESKLLMLVKRGNFNAIRFVLERQGRSRGYGANLEITTNSTRSAENIGEEMSIEEASRLYKETLVETDLSADDL